MRRKLPKSVKILAIMTPFIVSAFYSFAQQGKAVLKGIIKNEAGMAIPNGQVIIQSPISGSIWTVRTNAQGVFESPSLPLSQPYDITFKAAGHASQVLSKYRLSAVHENVIKIALKRAASTNQQEETLSGSVMDDENREALPGVTISSPSGNGTISNSKGKYVIKAGEGDELHFSCIGYKLQRVIVTEKMLRAGNLPDVRMELSLNKLKEVEVFDNGFQKVSKERSTASVTVVNMKAFHSRSGQPDILARMEGLVPGLSFNKTYQQGNGKNPLAPQNADFDQKYPNGGIISAADKANFSGDASYDQRLITLRGQTSLQSETSGFPLFVLNNVITDYEFIKKMNPNDIASITVLRDAVANSIYGAQAANGVIVMTTKIAKESGLSVSLNVNYSYTNKMSAVTPGLMNSAQLVQVTTDLYKQATEQNLWDWDVIAGGKLSPVEAVFYDRHRGAINDEQMKQQLDALAQFDGKKQLKKYLFTTPVTLTTGISLNYGSSKYSMVTSFNYTNSTLKPSPIQTQTYSLVTNNNFTFNERINAQLSMNLISSTNSGGYFPGIDIFSVLPYTRLKNEDGSNTLLNDYPSDIIASIFQQTGIDLNHSSLGDLANKIEQTSTKTLNLNLNGNLNVKLIKGLSFNGSYGLSSGNSKTTDLQTEDNNNLKDLILNYAVADPDDPGNITYNVPKKGGYYTETNAPSFGWNIRNQLLFDLPLGKRKHYINFLLGQEARYSKSSNTGSSTYGYDKQLTTGVPIDYVSLNNQLPPNNFIDANRLLDHRATINALPFNFAESISKGYGYYMNGSYSYENKYNFNASWRTDKSNFFGNDVTAQNKPSWSFGLSWNADKEVFMQKVHWLSGLSLRATLGITGNSPIPGKTATQDVFMYRNGSILPSLNNNIPSTKKNPLVTWEDTKTYNFTIDALLFNKLTVNIQHYRKYTTHLIQGYPTIQLAGNLGMELTGNNGSLQNIGYEMSLGGTILHAGKLSWFGNFNIAYNQNKITKYQDALNRITGDASEGPPTGIFNGYPLATVFAYNYAGLNAKGDPQARLANGSITSDPYAITSTKDLLYLGTSIAPWTGGFNNNVNYLGFTLSFTFIYNFGNVLNMPFSSLTDGVRIPENQNTLFFDRWQKAGDEKHTIIPRLYYSEQDLADVNIKYYKFGTNSYASGSYIKLRDINFGYNIPSSIASKFKLKSLSANFGLSGIGILIWAKNPKHYDPELVTSSGVRNAPPLGYTLGLSMSF